MLGLGRRKWKPASMNKESFKTAYLVLGIEASGTRLVTRILLNSGALGQDSHAQNFDKEIPWADDVTSTIVWRRSYPHGRFDVDLRLMTSRLASKGWSPHAFVIVRDAIPSTNAQAEALCLSTQSELEALKENRRQFSRLFSELHALDIDYHVLTLEGLILNSLNVQTWLTTFPGLRLPENFLHIRNVNEKHWLSWNKRYSMSQQDGFIDANSINEEQGFSLSLSEFIDKLSILRIKVKRISGEALPKAQAELSQLEKIIDDIEVTIKPSMISRLRELNYDLW